MLPNVDRAARFVAGTRWPWVVLIACAVLLGLGSSGIEVRHLPVPLLVGGGVAVAAGAWGVLDIAIGRLGRRAMAVAAAVVVLVVAAVLGLVLVDLLVYRSFKHNDVHMIGIAAASATCGMWLRVVVGRGSRPGQLVAAFAFVSWIAYLDLKGLGEPFRDAGIYFHAGRHFLANQPVYITSVPTRFAADHTLLPFLYPPFTLPLFAVWSLLPHAAAIAVIEALCLAAVVAGLRLLGVRWAFVPLLVFWPPLAIGIQVGNAACFGFLALAAGWRFAWTLPLGAVFKAQTGVMSLWLVRERRWRSLAIGFGAVALLALATLPLTGISAWWDWVHALGYFQTALSGSLSGVMGMALQRSVGAVAAVALTGVAILIAFLGRRRDGLARFAIAAVAASPTVYMHGFSLILPSILFLDAASAWGILGLTPWGSGAWLGAVVALTALVLGLTRVRLMASGGVGGHAADPGRGGGLDGSTTRAGSLSDESRGEPLDAALHPLGRRLEPWTDAAPRLAGETTGPAQAA